MCVEAGREVTLTQSDPQAGWNQQLLGKHPNLGSDKQSSSYEDSGGTAWDANDSPWLGSGSFAPPKVCVRSPTEAKADAPDKRWLEDEVRGEEEGG